MDFNKQIEFFLSPKLVQMPKTISALVLIIIISFSVSCNKPSPIDGGGGDNSKDTLTAGWTMTRMEQQQFTNIHFANSHGTAVSTSAIFSSDDGGLNWQHRLDYGNYSLGTGPLFRRNIAMDNTGNVVIPRGILNTGGMLTTTLVTHNYNNFSEVKNDYIINDNWFLKNNIGYGVTANDQETTIYFLKTTNGAATWDTVSSLPLLPIVTNVDVTRLAFVDSLTGWVTTPYGIFKTSDGGMHWSLQYQPQGIIINICAVDANTCYVGYYSNRANDQLDRISKTTDGGSNWDVVFSKDTGPNVNAFWFVSPDVGYMVRERRIYKSTDGGVTWNIVVSINSAICGFTDIYFTDVNHGWACSIQGQLLRFAQ
jgi:photosystem II stability/assembly factor-like uncharacterized protein